MRTVVGRGRGRIIAAALSLSLTVSASVSSGAVVVEDRTIAGAVTIIPTVSAGLSHVSPVEMAGAVTLTPTVAGTLETLSPVSMAGAVTILPVVTGALAVEGLTMAGAVTITPTVEAAATHYAPLVMSGAVSLTPTVSGAMNHAALVYISGAVSLPVTVAGAMTASGASGAELFSEDFSDFQLRSRGASNPFEISYQAGEGVWTPRHMYLNSEDSATYNNYEYAAFVDPTSPAVIATGYSPYSTSGGVLTIRAQPKPSALSSITLPNRHLPGGVDTGVPLAWVSGLMTTRHSFWVGRSFTAEVDAWMEKGQASFPAPLWLLTREDYLNLEIDVVEYQGHQPTWTNWAVHGSAEAGAWIERGLGDLSEGWFRYGMSLDGTTIRFFINGTQIGTATVPAEYADAHWYLISNNAVLNWDDRTGPDGTTPNPLDLLLRDLKVYAGSGTSWGGDASPALSGDASWVADPVGGVAPTLHLDLVNSRLWQGGALRHLGHVTSLVSGLRCGYGALLQAVGATAGTIVVRVDTPAGSHTTDFGPILSPYEWTWLAVNPGLGLQLKYAGGDLAIPGFGSGAKTIVRSWDASVTKALVQGSSVVSGANGNVGYVGERMFLGRSWYGNNPYAGTIKEVIFYPHTSALSDAAMAGI